jgi:hypothetical protein
LIGKVSITKCSSNKWIPKIQDELRTRNVAFEAVKNLTTLKKKLIENEYAGTSSKRMTRDSSNLGSYLQLAGQVGNKYVVSKT